MGSVFLQGCQEELESIRLVVNEKQSLNSFLLKFSEKGPTQVDVRVTNREGRPCFRQTQLTSDDTKMIRESLKDLKVCPYKNWKPCRNENEGYATVTTRAGLIEKKLEADILSMDCSQRSQVLCGPSAKEVQGILIVLILALGDPRAPEFKCD